MPGTIFGNATQESWHTFEETPGHHISYRKYFRKDTSNRISHYNYRLITEFNTFGRLTELYGQRNVSNTFDTFFGRGRQAPQQGAKSAFREFRLHDMTTHLPVGAHVISEDAGNTDATPKPGGYQVDKSFIHDATGRLLNTRHQLQPRGQTGNNFVPSYGTGRPSRFNDGFYFYGPDGQLLLELVFREENSSKQNLKLLVNDADSLVGEVDLINHGFTHYETVPGIGLRLGATAGTLGGTLTAELYYHWDHNGATTVITDEQGLIAADFGLSSPDGDTDLFGEPIREVSVVSRAMERPGINRGALYYVAGASVDTLLAMAVRHQEKNDHVLSMSSDPSVPMVGNNNYAANIMPFSFPEMQLSLEQSVVQGIIDGVRGFADALTNGYASSFRESLYNHDREFSAVRNVYAYGAGIVLGIATSIYFAAVSAPAKLAQASWAVRAAWLYTITNDIVGFVQSVRNIHAGKAGFFDYLGLAAPISTFQALRLQQVRNTKVISALDQAANAAVSLIWLKADKSEVAVAINRTERMADPGVVQAMNENRQFFRPNKGRSMPVSDVHGSQVQTISPPKDVLRIVRKELGGFVRSNYHTAGHADDVLRKLYKKLVGIGKDEDVGHVMDLKVFKDLAETELKVLEGILTSYADGVSIPFITKFLKFMYEAQDSGTNRAVGSAVTRVLAKMVEDGVIPQNAKIYFVLGDEWLQAAT
jgi:hypothetical protein